MGDEQLRIARGQKKAAVTRQLGTLERHIAENKSPDVVEAGLVLEAQAFDELGTAHDALAASFATETDISAGEVWFTKAHQEYVTKVKIARQWIDLKSGATGASGPSGNVTSTSTGNTGGDTNNTSLSQSNVMNLLTVPKIGIDKFDGNPIEYQNFMSIFDEMVGTVDDQVKLTRLLYYTTGPAKLAIKNCALVGGSAGYKEAREILSSRFGDSQLIAESLVNELKCGKPLRKPRDLQQMADELKMALRSLDDLGKLSEIDNQKSVKEILQRCPQYIRNQWSKKAVREQLREQMVLTLHLKILLHFFGKRLRIVMTLYMAVICLSHKCILKDLLVSLWWVEKRLERQMPWRHLAPRQCR